MSQGVTVNGKTPTGKNIPLSVDDSGRVILDPQALLDPNYRVEIDDTADPITYLGKAAIGSTTDEAVWQIARLDTTSGLSKTWADAANFTQVWDNRTSLTYS